MDRGDRMPERRPPKRKARELSPSDIGQELRQSRGSPRGYRGALWNLDYRLEYYNTRWSLKPGERMLSYNEFKELAEELKTTVITAVHGEGMRRHREETLRKEYRMVKPTVISTASPIPKGPRADSVASSTSPWSSKTPTPQPQTERTSISSIIAPKQKQSPAPALKARVTKAPLNSQDTTPTVAIQTIEPRVSPIVAASVAVTETLQPAAQKERVAEEGTPMTSECAVPEPKSTASQYDQEKPNPRPRRAPISENQLSTPVGMLAKSPQTQPESQVEATSQSQLQQQRRQLESQPLPKTQPQPNPQPQRPSAPSPPPSPFPKHKHKPPPQPPSTPPPPPPQPQP